MAETSWNAWQHNQGYGDLMYRRALGIEPEMESAKQLVRLIRPFYRPGMTVLDVGCGGGHFVRSLRSIDPALAYTGMDFTDYYLALARQVWNGDPHIHFLQGDLFHIPAANNSFDMVTCVTVLQNLPEYRLPLAEMVRVSRKYVLMRLLLGEMTHVIKRYEHGDRARNLPFTTFGTASI